MDLDSNPDVLLVRKHLVEHLGAPDEVYEVRGSPIPTSPIQALHLSYFAPGGPEAPVVFATCGAALFTMKDGRRVEAMMLFRRQPEPDAIAAIHRMLSSFAVFSEANDEAVRIGDVVRAGDDLHQFCAMDAILFLPPVPFVESFHRIPLTQGRQAEMIWLLPVFDAEADYALQHGPQALMMLFAAQGLDLTDPGRDEANTLILPEDARGLAEKRSEEERKKAAAKGPSPTSRAPTRAAPQGSGSFDVDDRGDAVAIVRRGAKPAKAKPEHLAVVPPPMEGEEPTARAALEARPSQPIGAKETTGGRPAPARRPVIAPPQKKNEPVRFDVQSGASIEPDRRRGVAPAPKPAPPRP
ncbi:suppressor of fused domain protein, partial [Myxococcota bacterium]|nr:suppressor of fused domain protein [Myxococcota bacterium]